MLGMRMLIAGLMFGSLARLLPAAEPNNVEALLSRPIFDPKLPLSEVQAYTESRVLPMPDTNTLGDWKRNADRMRRDTLDRVVFRGEAAKWRTAKTNVQWLDTIDGGPGYRIKKLRYEALPGMWIPALLYVPEKLDGKVPVVMNVNGHQRAGKSDVDKQIRCINQAKRGMLALNVEWIGTGQLATRGFQHYRMNQLDLCGTSGLAPFYLSMQRGLDVLLAHEHADPRRVAVTGMSGGGWQTILISSLDERVTLANPVAGYSSFRTRARHHVLDLGDSEQEPCDLAAIVDYAHLTAMRAPRPTLLTYNAADDCCYKAGYALPPLLQAARPIFKLFGKPSHLESHINTNPGTHNFGKDNRQALYRMIGAHFYAGDKSFDAGEIPCRDEVKTAKQLHVSLPNNNADFNTLALGLAKDLPRSTEPPSEESARSKWRNQRRERLAEIVRVGKLTVDAAEKTGEETAGDVTASFWKLRIGGAWTVPATELVRGPSNSTVIVVTDKGRKHSVRQCEKLLAAGRRVLAVDPFFIGESKIAFEHDFKFALFLSALGDRPVGLQARQLGAVAGWLKDERKTGPVTMVTSGPRSSLFGQVAAALHPDAIAGIELNDSLRSLKEVVERNYGFYDAPEVFCFGLLEEFDIPQLANLAVQTQRKQQRPHATLAQTGKGRERYQIEIHSPWNPKDYLIINYPEHFSSSQGWLMYYPEDIAPTMKMKKSFQWQIKADGSEAGYTCEFENGIVFSVQLVSKHDEVIQRLRVHNGSSKPLRHLRPTLCARLNRLSEFRHEGKNKFAHLDRTFTPIGGRPVSMRHVWSLIPEEKKREGEGRVWVGLNMRGQHVKNDSWYIAPTECDSGIIAVRSHSGDRHLAISWPKCRLVFTNYGVPCIHADPELPDCPPGKDVTVTGKVVFHQGNLDSLLKRLKPRSEE